jgi:hypothetical protein
MRTGLSAFLDVGQASRLIAMWARVVLAAAGPTPLRSNVRRPILLAGTPQERRGSTRLSGETPDLRRIAKMGIRRPDRLTGRTRDFTIVSPDLILRR